MELLATIALLAIAVCAAMVTAAFLELSMAVIEYIKGLPKGDAVTVFLSQADRDALVEAATKFRRNGPRVKKEAQAEIFKES